MFSQHSKSQQIYTINLNLGIPTNWTRQGLFCLKDPNPKWLKLLDCILARFKITFQSFHGWFCFFPVNSPQSKHPNWQVEVLTSKLKEKTFDSTYFKSLYQFHWSAEAQYISASVPVYIHPLKQLQNLIVVQTKHTHIAKSNIPMPVLVLLRDLINDHNKCSQSMMGTCISEAAVQQSLVEQRGQISISPYSCQKLSFSYLVMVPSLYVQQDFYLVRLWLPPRPLCSGLGT